MSTSTPSPLVPLEIDGEVLLKASVTAVKIMVDTIFGKVVGEVPKLQGDVLTVANTFVASVLPSSLAPIFMGILMAGEAAIPAKLNTELVAALTILGTQADTFLSKYA